MIYFQVEDVVAAFEKLSVLEANNWEAPAVVNEQENKKPVSRKRPMPKKSEKAVAGKKPAKASASLKEMMAARRREMKGEQVKIWIFICVIEQTRS